MPTGDVYQKSGGAYTKVGNIAGQGSSALAGLNLCGKDVQLGKQLRERLCGQF